MQSKLVAPRSFSPVSVPGLSNEAREAVNAALKAMSVWRNETAESSEKNSKQVIDKMAMAAAALLDGGSKLSKSLVVKRKASPKCKSRRWIT